MAFPRYGGHGPGAALTRTLAKHTPRDNRTCGRRCGQGTGVENRASSPQVRARPWHSDRQSDLPVSLPMTFFFGVLNTAS
jgi:hypothetical protein